MIFQKWRYLKLDIKKLERFVGDFYVVYIGILVLEKPLKEVCLIRATQIGV
jgi:hypothetical protein